MLNANKLSKKEFKNNKSTQLTIQTEDKLKILELYGINNMKREKKIKNKLIKFLIKKEKLIPFLIILVKILQL